MIHRKIGMTVLKNKYSQPLVKAVLKTDFIWKLLTLGERAESISICAESIGDFKGRMREGGGPGIIRVREVKNYKGLVSVIVIRPAVSASWQFPKLGFYPPTETGRQRLYPT